MDNQYDTEFILAMHRKRLCKRHSHLGRALIDAFWINRWLYSSREISKW